MMVVEMHTWSPDWKRVITYLISICARPLHCSKGAVLEGLLLQDGHIITAATRQHGYGHPQHHHHHHYCQQAA
jgi:hypothetical protein